MSTTPYCPCDSCSFPEVISNVPGLPTLQYRIGDFTAVRNALLQSLPGEVELANWKPTTTSDLALQMIEWWAYLADILTFYNQRIANQAYLGTADQDVSVRNLVSLLGYRPTPGIGATATLAALVKAAQPIVLPQGMAIQNKPGPAACRRRSSFCSRQQRSPVDLFPAIPTTQPPPSAQTAAFFSKGPSTRSRLANCFCWCASAGMAPTWTTSSPMCSASTSR